MLMKNILLSFIVLGSFSLTVQAQYTQNSENVVCSLKTKEQLINDCKAHETRYKNTIATCRQRGTSFVLCAEIFASLREDPICKLCIEKAKVRFRGNAGNRDSSDDEEEQEERMDDSWFDPGTPQCDKGTWYEEKGYC